MKYQTNNEFNCLNFKEAIIKYPDMTTWATGFLLTCHAQYSLCSCAGLYSIEDGLKLQYEVDRRFEKFQEEK